MQTYRVQQTGDSRYGCKYSVLILLRTHHKTIEKTFPAFFYHIRNITSKKKKKG